MDTNNENCPVCHEAITVFAIGECDHPICYRCSVRMRALCEQMYCPICRRDLAQVYLISEMKKYANIPRQGFIPNRKFKVIMENNLIKEKLDKLLEHRCPKCKGQGAFRYFRDLETHMRKEHTLFFCSLCVQHLKIFTSERKPYSRSELATHRRVGDKNDSSYKGHPLCEFCEERYMDNDELFRHLRKDHFFCHFCEADGNQDFYSDYDSLRNHFKQSHFLCQEGECGSPHVQFTNAFRSHIDLKAHVSTTHQKGLSKAQVRQARQIDIDINYGPFSQRHARDDRRSNRQESRPSKQSHRERFSEEEMKRAIESSLQTFKGDKTKRKEEQENKRSVQEQPVVSMDSDQFPTLSTSSVSSNHSQQSSGRVSPPESEKSLADRLALASSRSVQHGRMAMEEFPSLSSSMANVVSTNRLNFGKNIQGGISARTQSASSMKTTSSSVQPKLSVKMSRGAKEEDFPELPIAKGGKTSQSEAQWKPVHSSVQSFAAAPTPRNTLANTGFSVGVSSSNSIHNTVTHRKVKQTTMSLEQDFPTLSSTSSNFNPNLLNWSKKTTESQSKKNKQVDWFDVDDDINNFSMDKLKGDKNSITASIESTDTSDKIKNTKKKKDKDIKKKDQRKQENFPTTVTTTASSLDNIASSLLSSSSDSCALKKEKLNDDHRPKDESSFIKQAEEPPDDNRKHRDREEENVSNIEIDLKPLESGNPFSVLEKVKSEPRAPQPKTNSKVSGRAFTKEDFPSLTASKKPPPGFGATPSTTKNPPPGFAQKVPPPGFSAPVPTMTESNTKENDPVPLCNSMENFVYCPTEKFQERNKQLINDIMQLVKSDTEKFNLFKSCSAEFRSGGITAKEYIEKCQNILGVEGFNEILPELLTLLPDLDKQQKMYQALIGWEKGQTKTNPRKGKSAWKSDASLKSQFQVCATCRQILLDKDYSHHMTQHEPEFPSLNSQNPVGLGGPGFLRDWVRAK